MSRALLGGLAVALAPLIGCGDERTGGRSPGGASVTSSTGAGGGGEGGAGEGGSGAGGTAPACEACWSDACDTQVDACLAEEACSCRIDCDDDLACVAACAPSAAFETLLRCITEASLEACAPSCGTACEQCAFAGCPAERDACLDDPRCVCGLWCDDDPACEPTCGASPASEPLRACVSEQGPTCAATCE